MTPLKCVHLNSVTRFFLITILVSIFSQSFDCKAINAVTIGASEQGKTIQPIDPPITNDKPSRNNNIKGLGNISQPIDNGTRHEINLNNSLECPSGTCIVMAPPITTDEPSRNNDTNGLNRKRLVVDPSANDFKQTLHVNVRRRSDNRTIFEWPSMEMYPNNENALVSNSSIVENLKKDLNDSLSLSKLNNSLENNNRDTSGNLDVNLEEDTSNDPNPDLKRNETTDAVSSPSSSTSESEIYSENNTLVVTSSTTMEPLITSERSLTPLPPNELEKEQAKPGDQPEITTTSKLMIKTSNPIDEISASTLSNQVTAK